MWATVLSVVAIAATVANFLFTQWRTDRRESEKWRRDELLRLTSSLLQLSSGRQSGLIADLSHFEGTGRASPDDFDPWANTREMKVVVQQLHLLDGALADRARAVWHLHEQAERGYYPDENPWDDTDQLTVPADALDAAHSALVRQFRVTARLKSRAPKVRTAEGPPPIT